MSSFTQVDRSNPLLAVVCNGSHNLVFLDFFSQEIKEIVELKSTYLHGLCTHRPNPSSDGHFLLFTDLSARLIRVYDMKSKAMVRTIGAGHEDRMKCPKFLCMYRTVDTGASAVLVSCETSHLIEMFDFDSGEHIRTIGTGVGRGDGQLNCPGDMAIWTPRDDPTNAQVVVSEYTNNRLQFFRLADGSPVRSVCHPGQCEHPWALTIHIPTGAGDEEGLLVTADAENCRIHVLDLLTGSYLRCIGGPSQLYRWTKGISVYRPPGENEAATQVIVSNQKDGILQVFNLYSGEHIRSIGGSLGALFSSPFCLTMITSDEDDWDFILK